MTVFSNRGIMGKNKGCFTLSVGLSRKQIKAYVDIQNNR